MGSYSVTSRHGRAQEKLNDSFFTEHGWTAVPRLVQWMVTGRCELSCPHCLASCSDSAGDEMSLAEAAGLIEQVAAAGVEEFLLTGGEPLISSHLPEIISILRANEVRWSLNTAVAPSREVRTALEKWPPAFAAVSLDGPEPVHDEFRGKGGAFLEAMESLAYFSHIARDGVAAGTTVTTHNLAHLAETLGIVAESGATSWGLHMLVPEGRAARRRDLFLSGSQIRSLLRFAAAKRKYFPVTMADEIGYCGFWEPLVRSEPFFCGAGRAQCVVLPDGEVVPCTTMDTSTSAGNVRTQKLMEIWRTGFSELRDYQPEGRCARCRFASACEGGCWLQRRHGTQCFKSVWTMPKTLTKAGLAVCVGLVGAGMFEAGPVASEPARGRRTPIRSRNMAEMELLQRYIVQWYASQLRGRRTIPLGKFAEMAEQALPKDTATDYFLSFVRGKRPKSLTARADRISAAMKTKQKSLCLFGLFWRDVSEWCLDGNGPAQRTEEERKALGKLLITLGKESESLRNEIWQKKLDPFLRRTHNYRNFLVSKAGPSPGQRLERTLAKKRGHVAGSKITRDSVDAFLKAHRFAESIRLAFSVVREKNLIRLKSGERIPVGGQLDVFDMLIVSAECPGGAPELLFNIAGDPVKVLLPAGTELSYADVLRLADEQNKAKLAAIAEKGFSGPNKGLAFPALRSLYADLDGQPEKDRGKMRRITWRLIDLYLF